QPSQVSPHTSAIGSQSSPLPQVGTPAPQELACSSQVSAPVQLTPSSQGSLAPAWHFPAWQVSPLVQNLPSSQLAPLGRSVHAWSSRFARHTWQEFSGFSLPSGKQRAPIWHPLQVPEALPPVESC